jgi:hypothetical protein
MRLLLSFILEIKGCVSACFKFIMQTGEAPHDLERGEEKMKSSIYDNELINSLKKLKMAKSEDEN